MVEYTPNTRPADQGRPNPQVHETTIVKPSRSNGTVIGVVAVVLLAIAGFLIWSAGNDNTATPAAGVNEQVAPAADPALSVPAAPDAPALAPETTTPVAPGAEPAMDAAPAETAPAPANGG